MALPLRHFLVMELVVFTCGPFILGYGVFVIIPTGFTSSSLCRGASPLVTVLGLSILPCVLHLSDLPLYYPVLFVLMSGLFCGGKWIINCCQLVQCEGDVDHTKSCFGFPVVLLCHSPYLLLLAVLGYNRHCLFHVFLFRGRSIYHNKTCCVQWVTLSGCVDSLLCLVC